MKSPMIHPGENFTWTFSRPGVYTYVDAVVLGTVGKIIVQ
jgi:plastocyanin